MKLSKRIISAFLVVLMLVTSAPLTGLDSLFAPKAQAVTMKQTISSMKVGDLITYGSYPQTDVTSSMGSTLTNAAPSTSSWKSYNYYDNGVKSDYMKYYDLSYGGNRYRGVYFSKYRPYKWIQSASSNVNDQSDNGYKIGKIYWFRYDPLTWRILDPETGYVICENIIDSQAFNDEYYSHGKDAHGSYAYYNDKTYKHFANNWEYSTIRKWLNETFYTTAFSSSERRQIPCTKHTTPAYSTTYSAYYVGETGDYVFLPTYRDMFNTSYGFSSGNSAHDISRRAHSSDYAKSQGLDESSSYTDKDGKYTSYYLLRSAGGDSHSATAVYYDSYVYDGWSTYYANNGIRPALCFNPSSIMSLLERIYGDSQDYTNKEIYFKEKEKDSFKTVKVTFKKSWLNSDNKSYNHELARFCSFYSMLCYSPDYGTESTVYTNNYLTSIGFEPIFVNMDAKRDEVNTFIAAKTVYFDGEKKNILFIGTIGSNKEQWYSNFDPQGWDRKNGLGRETGKHCGFTDAKNFVATKLDALFADSSYALKKENTILLFTGHSRGAATANLLAAEALNKNWANSDSIYAYTFATPNNTPDKNYDNSKYNYIYNIVNPEDMVTHVMLKDAWGYHKYGRTYVLPSKTNTYIATYNDYLKKMREIYRQYTGEKYDPYPIGEAATYNIIKAFNKNVPEISDFYNKKLVFAEDKISLLNPIKIYKKPFDFFKETLLPIVSGKNKMSGTAALLTAFASGGDFYQSIASYFMKFDYNLPGNGAVVDTNGRFGQAHSMSTYCAYMQILSESILKSPKNSLYGQWNCPVDIEIYDNETSELVGKIANNVIDETIEAKENSVVMSVDGDTKSYFLPSDGDYTVKIIGNDNGEADYTLSAINGDFNETSRVNYFDIEVVKNNEMTSSIEANATIEDISLLDNNNIVEADEYFENIEDATVNVEVNILGSGAVSGGGDAKSGDYITLTATEMCSTFVGWYNGTNIISEEATYKFRVSQDMTVTAKFTEGNHSIKEVVTEPTCVNEGNISNVCENCGLTELVRKTEATGHDLVEHEAKLTSCIENGYNAYQACSKCEYTTKVEIPAYSHNMTIQNDNSNVIDNEDGTHSIVCALCKELGTTESHIYDDGIYTEATENVPGYTIYTCTICNSEKKVDDKQPEHNHTSDKGTVTKKATCTATGTKTYRCTACGDVLKTETIKATGHKETILEARTATVKKSGLTAGKKCSVCGKILTAQKMTLAQVTGLKASTVAKTSIKLSWTKIAGAKYYKVEQSTDGKTWKAIKTVDTNSYTVSKLTAGKKYQFRVTALDSTKKISGKASTTLKTGTLTAAPTVTVKSSKSKTAVASWKKVTGASKYIVYKSTDGKKWTKVTTTTKLTYTLTKLTGGKKIYVKVTAVNAYSKESAASSVKNVTVKK